MKKFAEATSLIRTVVQQSCRGTAKQQLLMFCLRAGWTCFIHMVLFMNLYRKYLNAEYQINEGLIRMDISSARPEGYVKDPHHRMKTMETFLAALGNPHKGIPAIHVTGTSGKGSVCAAIAGILQRAGLKVGLHISPYLQSATEKIWIDGHYISAQLFADLVDWAMPHAAPLCTPETPASIHGMTSVAIALEAFRREKVDVIVFEAGCGGRYDLTSFVDTKVAVITNVGLDHIVSLGPTIENIAWHKAGIARSNTPLITGAQGSALSIIAEETKQLNSPLIVVPPSPNVQVHNTQLAIAACREVASSFDVVLTPAIIQSGLTHVQLPGRFERIDDTATVFLDGAHNTDKLTAAVSHATEENRPGPKIAVVGLLGTKAKTETISPLINNFDAIIATQPTVYGKTAFAAEETAALFLNTKQNVIIQASTSAAVEQAIEMANGGIVLICGSFYLCGEVRNRWYPKKDVVLQKNSWPSQTNIIK